MTSPPGAPAPPPAGSPLAALLDASIAHRGLVLGLTVAMAAYGAWALSRLDVDAFPDTTPVQVQVNVAAAALSPLEAERQLTLPVEQAVGGLPGLAGLRSLSRYGLSQVVATFEDGTDLYRARQLVGERLSAVELPEGLGRPELGPAATGLGEVFHYLVTGEGADLDLLAQAQEWVIAPRLRSVSGVAEVNTWGGHRRQYQVRVDPARLVPYGLTLDDLGQALRAGSLAVGGGAIEGSGEMHLVRGVGLATSAEALGAMVVAAHRGVPVRVRDVAEVERGHTLRRGAVTARGQGEAVLGLAFLLVGENAHRVTSRLARRLEEVQPELRRLGLVAEPVYQRTELVDQVLATVKGNLLEGALLVVAVLFAFLGSLRAGLVVALAIPLSMLFASSAMLRFGIAGSLMSLGAIDFGLIVDSSVILVENGMRHLSLPGSERRGVAEVLREAALEVRGPTLFGELIILCVYLPVLTLEGVEGRLFRPMALVAIFALAGSLVLSLTFTPALASLVLPRRPASGEGLATRWARRLYHPALEAALRARGPVVAAAALGLAVGLVLALGMGWEFIPRLQEGGIVINTVRLAGVSLEESVRYGTRLERLLLARFPDEVREVWTRTGSAEVATDPMGIEVSDVFVTLQPRARWTRAATQEALVERMREDLAGMPGMRQVYTQPIEMRVQEMIAGVRADLGVKLYGDDLEVLRGLAARVEAVLAATPGSADLYTEQLTGTPVLEVRVDPEASARHGVPARRVLETVEALGGIPVGEVLEGERRAGLALCLGGRYRQDPEALGEVLVPTADGARLPLGRLARIEQTTGPAAITREWQRRRVAVQCNVRGRDMGGFVDEARSRIAAEVEFPAGYYPEYGGQFEHLQRSRRRLALVIPLAMGLVLLLLHACTRSTADTLLIATGIPFAGLGGVLALAIRGMPFSISAAVGFVATCGVAMLGGLVLVSACRALQREGMPLDEAVREAALRRLRPVLMTTLVASLGLLPMALHTGVGAEVQRPLATVVVGGVVSANLLTLLVLPALLAWRVRSARPTA